MPGRGNQPVGRTTRCLIALTVGVVLLIVGIGIHAMRETPAPLRGSGRLPAQQAEQAGASPKAAPAR